MLLFLQIQLIHKMFFHVTLPIWPPKHFYTTAFFSLLVVFRFARHCEHVSKAVWFLLPVFDDEVRALSMT